MNLYQTITFIIFLIYAFAGQANSFVCSTRGEDRAVVKIINEDLMAFAKYNGPYILYDYILFKEANYIHSRDEIIVEFTPRISGDSRAPFVAKITSLKAVENQTTDFIKSEFTIRSEKGFYYGSIQLDDGPEEEAVCLEF